MILIELYHLIILLPIYIDFIIFLTTSKKEEVSHLTSVYFNIFAYGQLKNIVQIIIVPKHNYF